MASGGRVALGLPLALLPPFFARPQQTRHRTDTFVSHAGGYDPSCMRQPPTDLQVRSVYTSSPNRPHRISRRLTVGRRRSRGGHRLGCGQASELEARTAGAAKMKQPPLVSLPVRYQSLGKTRVAGTGERAHSSISESRRPRAPREPIVQQARAGGWSVTCRSRHQGSSQRAWQTTGSDGLPHLAPYFLPALTAASTVASGSSRESGASSSGRAP